MIEDNKNHKDNEEIKEIDSSLNNEDDKSDDSDQIYEVKPTILETVTDNIVPIKIEDEMKVSFLDYSMSVIVSRGSTRCSRWTKAGS